MAVVDPQVSALVVKITVKIPQTIGLLHCARIQRSQPPFLEIDAPVGQRARDVVAPWPAGLWGTNYDLEEPVKGKGVQSAAVVEVLGYLGSMKTERRHWVGRRGRQVAGEGLEPLRRHAAEAGIGGFRVGPGVDYGDVVSH